MLRLLTIGNSFADDATRYLPEVAASAGSQIEVFRANLGGASLQRHVEHLRAFRENPADAAGRPYRLPTLAEGGDPAYSLPEVLGARAWDVITIQQVSHLSFRLETYHPWVEELIAAIRDGAPQAEIVLHQTWAYREDHPIFFRNDGFTPDRMYSGLRDAYDALSRETGFRLVVVGDAFHLARSTRRWRFPPLVERSSVTPDTIPDQSRSLNVGWRVKPDPTNGTPQVELDAIHANVAGRYLGALVFHFTLFGVSERPIAYRPEALGEADARLLQAIAQTAVLAARAGSCTPSGGRGNSQ